MNMQPVEYLVHLSNVLLLVSYSVRDILWLRWFAVAAAVANVPYYLAQTTVLWPPVVWGGVFLLINLYQIARIYLERRPVVLSAEEQQLYDLGFRALRPREFVSLLLAGQWRDAATGDRIVEQGRSVDRICIPISGSVEVRRDGQRLGSFAPGQIIGLALAVTGETSSFDAAFTEPGRYLSWPLESLRKFFDKRPELRVALQRLASNDLATKVERLMPSNPPAAERAPPARPPSNR
jgi:CRP-like cAMP-binding protein